MVGGPEAAFDECLPILQAMGKKIVRMGESGAGQLTKLANQILVVGNMMGVCECLVFARKAGLDQKKVIDSLSAGAASSWSLVNLGPKAVDKDFAPGFKIKLLQKDLKLVLGSGDELNVALPNTSVAHQLYNALEAAGRGEDGTQALIEVFEKLTGLNVGDPRPGRTRPPSGGDARRRVRLPSAGQDRRATGPLLWPRSFVRSFDRSFTRCCSLGPMSVRSYK